MRLWLCLHHREGFVHRNLGTTLQNWAAPGHLDCRAQRISLENGIPKRAGDAFAREGFQKCKTCDLESRSCVRSWMIDMPAAQIRATMAVGFDPGNLQSRWAPCTQAHGLGQGQLPSRSIRPRGIRSSRTPQLRQINLGPAEAEYQRQI